MYMFILQQTASTALFGKTESWHFLIQQCTVQTSCLKGDCINNLYYLCVCFHSVNMIVFLHYILEKQALVRCNVKLLI